MLRTHGTCSKRPQSPFPSCGRVHRTTPLVASGEPHLEVPTEHANGPLQRLVFIGVDGHFNPICMTRFLDLLLDVTKTQR